MLRKFKHQQFKQKLEGQHQCRVDKQIAEKHRSQRTLEVNKVYRLQRTHQKIYQPQQPCQNCRRQYKNAGKRHFCTKQGYRRQH